MEDRRVFNTQDAAREALAAIEPMEGKYCPIANAACTSKCVCYQNGDVYPSPVAPHLGDPMFYVSPDNCASYVMSGPQARGRGRRV